MVLLYGTVIALITSVSQVAGTGESIAITGTYSIDRPSTPPADSVFSTAVCA
jgi:hypothetical protein